jgi:hypothetical protein
MSKQIIPLDAFVRVNHKHPPNYVFDVRMHFERKNYRIFLDSFQ